MFKRSTPKLAIYLSALASIALLAGCVTTQEKQVLAPPLDANAVEIISQVKKDPSIITGGGMIYELFVGDHFAARYNERSKILNLTDIENNNACEYTSEGALVLPEGAGDSYLKSCSHLSTNTIDFLNQ